MSGQNESEDILAMWKCAGNHGVKRIMEGGIKEDIREKQMPGGKDNMKQGQPSDVCNKKGQMEDKMKKSWKTE
jgi:hypothetical protein